MFFFFRMVQSNIAFIALNFSWDDIYSVTLYDLTWPHFFQIVMSGSYSFDSRKHMLLIVFERQLGLILLTLA